MSSAAGQMLDDMPIAMLLSSCRRALLSSRLCSERLRSEISRIIAVNSERSGSTYSPNEISIAISWPSLWRPAVLTARHENERWRVLM